MAAYDPSEWTDLGVAAAGASAALAGLVFVAVSINIDRILAYPWLPGRAGETVILLVGVLVESLLLVAPGQSRTALGVELLIAGAVCWGFVTALHAGAARYRDREAVPQQRLRIAVGQAASIPAIVAGISLVAEFGGGLYWLLGGIALSFVAAALHAWVLLIEIVR